MASPILFFLFSAFLSLIFSLDHHVSAQNNIVLTGFTKLNFPPNVVTVGSLTFDILGRGPYAGSQDGRIFAYSRLTNSWLEYGYTSPNRTKAFCDGTADPSRSSICGYTAGLGFKPLSQFLYACDAFVGLTVVGSLGGEAATLVPTTATVPPLRLPNSVEAASDGFVYFVDSSAVYDAWNSATSVQTGDSTGRLLRYNPVTKGLTTLLSQLGRPVGVATDPDASFLLVSETNKNRIQKLYLKGEKAGTSETFMTLAGSPNKIKRNQEGNFWVALNIRNSSNAVYAPQGVKISSSGEILATVDLSREYQQRINTVMQQGQEIFVAAYNLTYVGRYQIEN